MLLVHLVNEILFLFSLVLISADLGSGKDEWKLQLSVESNFAIALIFALLRFVIS